MHFLGFDRAFYKSLITLAFPVILQFFLFHLLNLIDNWMVASLGTATLAGVALSNKITFILNLLIFGISNGVTVYTAQVFSLKDYTAIHKAYSFLMIRVLLVAMAIFIPAFCFAPAILSLATSDAEIILIGSHYLPIVAISYIPMGLAMSISWLMRSFQEVTIPLYATSVAVLINLILSYYFMFIMHMGVVGVALGTVIARFVELAFLLYAVQGKALRSLLGVRAFLDGLRRSSRKFRRNLFKLMIPVAFNEFVWVLSLTALDVIYVRISRSEYATYVIASGAAEFSYFIFHALAISCGIILGNHVKEGKEVLKRMGSSFVKLGFFFALVNMVTVFSLSFIVPSFFPNLENPQLIGSFLRTIAVFTVPYLLSTLMNIAILRAGGDAVFALIVDQLPQWTISLPLAFLFSQYYGASIRDIYLLVASVELCKSLILFVRVRSCRWIKSVVHLEEGE